MDEGTPYGIIDPDYARVFTKARCAAWGYGYALLMHGSFTRDLDLLAAPWTERACDPEHLVQAIALKADLNVVPKPPSEKPHGRKAWTLMFKTFGDPRFIDLSIMPLRGPVPFEPARERVEIDAASVGVTLKEPGTQL
jgi:hypothetical protein